MVMLFIESKTPNYTISSDFSLPTFAHEFSVAQPLLVERLRQGESRAHLIGYGIPD
jgi:hypothetical protein